MIFLAQFSRYVRSRRLPIEIINHASLCFFLPGHAVRLVGIGSFFIFLVRVRIGYSILRRIVLLCCSLKLIIIFIFCSF